MVKAIVKKGVFVPQDPLPSDWTDGIEVDVDRSAPPTPQELEALDEWYAELEAQACQLDPENDRILKETIALIRKEEKETARKRLGLEG